MGRFQKFFLGLILVGVAGALLAYFLSDPDRRRTERYADMLFVSAPAGAYLVDAIEASPNFFSITLGKCGHIAVSAATRDQGPLIFFPKKGEIGRYHSFAEFFEHNGAIFSGEENCRDLSVVYMAAFPVRALVSLRVNKQGRIVAANAPVIFD